MIDPIDGTRSFILGQLHWATLIALNDGDAAGRRRRPSAVRRANPSSPATVHPNGAATGSDGALATRRCPRVEDAIVATTDPRHFVSVRQMHAWRAATDGTRLVRYGGDCYCYTQVAMGLTDIVIETGLQPYDVQALIPLIEYAGGVMTNWEGGSCQRGGDVLACGDPELHAQILRRIASR